VSHIVAVVGWEHRDSRQGFRKRLFLLDLVFLAASCCYSRQLDAPNRDTGQGLMPGEDGESRSCHSRIRQIDFP